MDEITSIEAPHLTLTTVGYDAKAFSEMEKVFARSEDVHWRSMDEITKSLSFPKAIEVLQHSTLANRASILQKVQNLMTGSQNLRAQKDTGFGGLDGARKLLNDMIHESMTKYDAEIAKCTDYYAKQCALMEVARGQISAANFVAATSRALILDAQNNINRCEILLPETKQELKDHNRKCKDELKSLNTRLKAV